MWREWSCRHLRAEQWAETNNVVLAANGSFSKDAHSSLCAVIPDWIVACWCVVLLIEHVGSAFSIACWFGSEEIWSFWVLGSTSGRSTEYPSQLKSTKKAKPSLWTKNTLLYYIYTKLRKFVFGMIKRAINIKYWTFIKSVNKFPPFCAREDRSKQEQETGKRIVKPPLGPRRTAMMAKVVTLRQSKARSSRAEGSPSGSHTYLYVWRLWPRQ